MVEYISPSRDNSMRMRLIHRLIGNISARKKLLEMQRGYYAIASDKDEIIYAGFSVLITELIVRQMFQKLFQTQCPLSAFGSRYWMGYIFLMFCHADSIYNVITFFRL